VAHLLKVARSVTPGVVRIVIDQAGIADLVEQILVPRQPALLPEADGDSFGTSFPA